MDSEYDEVGSNATMRRIGNYPSIAEMIAAGKSAAEKIRRNTQESFMAWFDRAEYLSIARTHYMMLPADHLDHMTPADYAKFRMALGIDITTGKWLPRLYQYRDKATAHYQALADQSAERARLSGTADGFQWPGAKTTLAKMEELWNRNETAAADAKATKQAKAEAKEAARKASEATAEDNARKAAKYEAALTALADAIAKPDATIAVVKDILWEAGFADTVSTAPSADSATSDEPGPEGSNATEPPANDTPLAGSSPEGRASRSKKAVKEVVQQAPAPVGGSNATGDAKPKLPNTPKGSKTKRQKRGEAAAADADDATAEVVAVDHAQQAEPAGDASEPPPTITAPEIVAAWTKWPGSEGSRWAVYIDNDDDPAWVSFDGTEVGDIDPKRGLDITLNRKEYQRTGSVAEIFDYLAEIEADAFPPEPPPEDGKPESEAPVDDDDPPDRGVEAADEPVVDDKKEKVPDAAHKVKRRRKKAEPWLQGSRCVIPSEPTYPFSVLWHILSPRIPPHLLAPMPVATRQELQKPCKRCVPDLAPLLQFPCWLPFGFQTGSCRMAHVRNLEGVSSMVGCQTACAAWFWRRLARRSSHWSCHRAISGRAYR